MPSSKLMGQYRSSFDDLRKQSDVGRLRVLLGTLVLLLILAVGTTYWLGYFVIESNQRVIRQQWVVKQVDETLASVQDAETGQRGYLLTGDEMYLEPYHQSVKEVGTYLDALAGCVKTGEINGDRDVELTQLVETKLKELEQTIALQRAKQTDEAMAIVRSGVGKKTMDGIRRVLGGMEGHQQDVLHELQRKSSQATTIRSVIFVVIVGLGILGSLWAYRRLVTEMERRARAMEELAKQKDLVSVTLGSIGDAVIVTDSESKVAFMNPVAEELTGWKFSAASGRDLTEIFRIIREGTREVVESPVAKVLRLGVVVGLANHTLLIKKDGSEVPIDDSGAPIRDAEGKVYGVVLIFRDFSEHKEAERKLVEAKESADAANRAKDRFLATLSHELRTPLTPVLATLGIWEGSADIPADMQPDIQMLRRNVDLEVRLIDDLLDLTRIAKGKLSLNLETVDAAELLNLVVGIVQSEVDAKRIKLRVELNSQRHFVKADSARLQQVMWNVLKNAVKFTEQGGTITVETREAAGGELEVIFRDTGIGMNSDTLARLFEPFEQGSEDTSRRYGGLGLGMALSKALVEAQGGRIRAESAGLGKGATFVVMLPLVEGATGVARAPAFPVSGAEVFRSLSILLVEDHADTAKAMRRILVGFGHKVSTAGTVEEALTLSRDGVFDLMLSDLGLPDGTGIDLVKRVHAERPLRAVALTGFGMEDDVARCKAAGFSAHLTKPVNLRSLKLVIEEVAGGANR